MTKLEKKLGASLQRLGIDADSTVVIAVSGGADSTALFDALVRSREQTGIPKQIFAAHLNHQLRGAESDEDERFVADLAARSALTCAIERIDLADQLRREPRNLEATARRLRYDFLRRVAEQQGAEMVLTAHTRDDQVETVLMRWLRGSGPPGLRGIHAIRPLSEQVHLIRPMLGITRDEVIRHCRHYELAFCTDSSNFSLDFTRNRVRHELLPLLRDFNPRIDLALLQTSELITEDEDYLHQLASEFYTKISDGNKLEIEPLKNLHPAIRRRIIRRWLNEIRGSLQRIDSIHLFAIEQLMVRQQSGRTIELPGGWLVLREFDRLRLSRSQVNEPKALQINFPQDQKHYFGPFLLTLRRNVPRESLMDAQPSGMESYSARLRESKELSDLKLRTRRQGDAYVPAGKRHPMKLKTLMIRHQVPLSQRDEYPVLVTGDDRIVWSPGLPIAREFAASEFENEACCALVTAEKLNTK